MADTEVVVGRIGKAHGIKGEVSVELRTDEPDRRFAIGAALRTQAPRGQAPRGQAARGASGTGQSRPATLTVRATRWHQSRLLVTFEEVRDRTAAESLRGVLLAVEIDPSQVPEDPEEFYDHQLVGLRVVTTDGTEIGELAEVVHGTAQDLRSVKGIDGREILVPFVAQLVPEVDLEGGHVVVEDLPGLLSPAVEDEEGGA
jgi:16S rRNA processing protein RimM